MYVIPNPQEMIMSIIDSVRNSEKYVINVYISNGIAMFTSVLIEFLLLLCVSTIPVKTQKNTRT